MVTTVKAPGITVGKDGDGYGTDTELTLTSALGSPQTPISPTIASSGTTTETTGSTSTAPTYTFPPEIETYGRFMRISAFPYSRANRNSPAARKGNYTGHVILPFPSSLTISYIANYFNEALGLTGYYAADATESVLKNFSAMRHSSRENSVESLSTAISNGLNRLQKDFAGIAVYNVLDNFNGGPSMAAGYARNPHLAVLYQGVSFREHSFTWQLIARNAEESRTIENVIKFFKTAQAPDYDTTFANHLFKYPDEFELELIPNDFLFTFPPCVLTNFAVSYHDAGVPVYFKDTKAPAAVSISLHLSETEIVTRGEITKLRR